MVWRCVALYILEAESEAGPPRHKAPFYCKLGHALFVPTLVYEQNYARRRGADLRSRTNRLAGDWRAGAVGWGLPLQRGSRAPCWLATTALPPLAPIAICMCMPPFARSEPAVEAGSSSMLSISRRQPKAVVCQQLALVANAADTRLGFELVISRARGHGQG